MSSGQSELIQRTLKPLIDEKEGLEEQLSEMQIQVNNKKEEIRTIDKLLRAAGLLEPVQHKARRRHANGSEPEGISEGMRERAIGIIKRLPKEWRQADLIEAGIPRGSVSNIMKQLQAERVIRLTGAKYPEGQSSGIKSRHYALIEGSED